MFWHVSSPDPPFFLHAAKGTRHVLACFGMFSAATLPFVYRQPWRHGMFWHVVACFQPRPSLLFTYSHAHTACFDMFWHVPSLTIPSCLGPTQAHALCLQHVTTRNIFQNALPSPPVALLTDHASELKRLHGKGTPVHCHSSHLPNRETQDLRPKQQAPRAHVKTAPSEVRPPEQHRFKCCETSCSEAQLCWILLR